MTYASSQAALAAKLEAEATHAWLVADPAAEDLFRRAVRAWRRAEGPFGDGATRCAARAEQLARESARSGVRSGVRL